MPSDDSRPPTLLLVDVQAGFDDPLWGNRNNPDAERNISALLTQWRASEAPVIHVRHVSPAGRGRFPPGSSAGAFKPEALPQGGEPVIEKSVNSAFIGTDLDERLRGANASKVVIAGFTTDHCCSTTARMAGNLGFETFFVSDATATFDRIAPDGELIPAEVMHRTALASLNGEFAEVMTTDEAVRRLLPSQSGGSTLLQ